MAVEGGVQDGVHGGGGKRKYNQVSMQKYAWRLWNLNYAMEPSYKLTTFWNSSSLVLW